MVQCIRKRNSSAHSAQYELFLTMSQKVRPAARLMNASAKCAELGSAYGQCVLKGYANISKDACAKEFQLFRACVTASMKK